ncbi:50S ribosomal protein L23 [Candidatus Gottesmanbacteria bacterium]|nr:50S ribosomal protein L23 [Candidatus Gottesmanbacteria bacterium]
MIIANIIRKPIITERSLIDARLGVFTFEVDKNANKHQIKEKIENLFKVHVKKITSANFKGKKRLVGKKRTPVYQPDRKKVWVRLAKDEKIDLFEVGEKK